MPAKEYKRRILEVMAEVLRAAGFRKKGTHFARDIADVVHLVTLQSSVGSTADAVRVTVNLGVWVPALEGDAIPDIWSAHWRERLGFVMPDKRDVWWDAASEGEARVVADRIANAVRDFGLPALSRLANRRALLDLWRTGSSPGLTEVFAERLMKRLGTIVEAG